MYKGSDGQPGSEYIDFSYNADGLRVGKQRLYYDANGVAHFENTSYTLHGKNIVHLVHEGNNLHFWYDASGKPALVEYNGVKYGYLQNLQGDIVGIIDSLGNEVVKYTYDAWGKPLSCTGTMAASLGKLNPFRYRGYVFDEETGLYYLRSRYYNQILCRFVNADTIIGYLNIKEQNIFAYCSNNCVTYGDDDGEDSVNKVVPDYPKWKYRIDYKNGKYIGNGQFIPHIHLYDPKNIEYAINLDGTPHDANQTKMITPGTDAYEVLQHLEDKGIWPPKNFSGGEGGNTPSQSSSRSTPKSKIKSNDVGTTAIIVSINAHGYTPYTRPMSLPQISVSNLSRSKFSLSSVMEAFTPGRNGNLIDIIYCFD